MNTYLYEVSYRKEGQPNFLEVRAQNELDAACKASELIGDCSVFAVSRIGN